MILSIPINPDLYYDITGRDLEIPNIIFTMKNDYFQMYYDISIKIEPFNIYRYRGNNIYDINIPEYKKISYVKLSGIYKLVTERITVNDDIIPSNIIAHQFYILYPTEDFTKNFQIDEYLYSDPKTNDRIMLKYAHYKYKDFKDIFNLLKYRRNNIKQITYSNSYEELIYKLRQLSDDKRVQSLNIREIQEVFMKDKDHIDLYNKYFLNNSYNNKN